MAHVIFSFDTRKVDFKFMFISRAPLRISLGGGGTDLPSYYSKYGGFFISAAIDKYTYVSVSSPFVKKIILKYSNYEEVDNPLDIKNPLIRETLFEYSPNPNDPIEIISFADIPSGTGLGSSGSFCVALLKSLSGFYKLHSSSHEIAEKACKIEIERLNEPVGKQDQFISAFGGINSFEISRSGDVSITPLHISQETLSDLENNLMLFYTGIQRKASSVLVDQDKKTIESDAKTIENLHRTKELGKTSFDLLKNSKLNQFALLMHEHWINKRKRSLSMSNDYVNKIYDAAIANGALGGKIVGAGGGGFLMFYAENKTQLRDEMKKFDLVEMKFQFNFSGVQPILI